LLLTASAPLTSAAAAIMPWLQVVAAVVVLAQVRVRALAQQHSLLQLCGRYLRSRCLCCRCRRHRSPRHRRHHRYRAHACHGYRLKRLTRVAAAQSLPAARCRFQHHPRGGQPAVSRLLSFLPPPRRVVSQVLRQQVHRRCPSVLTTGAGPQGRYA